MDPNANLAEQRRIAARIMRCGDREHPDATASADYCECVYNGERLAELVQSLDLWIRGGGFLPSDWRR